MLYLYSETISRFISQIKRDSFHILAHEAKLKIGRTRVEWQGRLYPLNFVVFEHPNKLGFFDPSLYQIGLNKNLLYTAKRDVLKNIIRHELAHFLCFLKYGPEAASHGKEYRDLCKTFNWGPEVFSAYANIEELNNNIEGDLLAQKVILKIKKLMSLATSSNSHEAQLATSKANQLLLKYNLENIETDQEETIYVKRVLKSKRNSAKLQSIYEILQTFFVQPVFNYGPEGHYLEVLGKRVNVEMADYVASFLDTKLDELWLSTKKLNPELKGLREKNSFFKGVAHGYVKKINDDQSSTSHQKELIALQLVLKDSIKKVYGRSSRMQTSKGVSNKGEKFGQEVGKNLSISKALQGKNNFITKLLS